MKLFIEQSEQYTEAEITIKCGMIDGRLESIHNEAGQRAPDAQQQIRGEAGKRREAHYKSPLSSRFQKQIWNLTKEANILWNGKRR